VLGSGPVQPYAEEEDGGLYGAGAWGTGGSGSGSAAPGPVFRLVTLRVYSGDGLISTPAAATTTAATATAAASTGPFPRAGCVVYLILFDDQVGRINLSS
jgi:hypothetical protein